MYMRKKRDPQGPVPLSVDMSGSLMFAFKALLALADYVHCFCSDRYLLNPHEQSKRVLYRFFLHLNKWIVKSKLN